MSVDQAPEARFVGDERAQTVQDFAVGISIFLLVVGGVFLMFPTLFTPYEAAIADEGPDSQADRIAIMIADNVSDEETANSLTADEVSHWFDKDDDALRDAVGVSSSTRVNVTLTTLGTDDKRPLELNDSHPSVSTSHAAAGPAPGEKDVSVAARIVTARDASVFEDRTACEPACRLVVRVW